MTAANQKITSVQVQRKFDRNKLKPKRWSHQDELAELKGKRVMIVNSAGNGFVGVLVDSDQYTLRFRAEGQQSTLTYFKHALTGYGAAV